ncbi:ABC transporter permease [Dyella nitratireducens]|uniref:ABC transporter permease n=1 Tax=Dyella nitratireducens TaxID=1849580 RepID=A0ABQ1FP80_9GAMM|nr:ABC transporter permease [Dyella nitratireducens]GGA22658.1 ABC transporter permease [Dyella nitratireducens]GLQ44081.1 ABC transporter permease [Dyella nitratireducens]
MTLHPMIAALRKHKAGVVLIALQIALTLAIVCNAVFIIYARVQNVQRPTGLDESNLFMITQQWVGAPNGDDPASIQKLDAMMNEDISALRSMPDVESVTPINSLPLFPSSWNGAMSLKPGAELRAGNARTTYYFGDENLMKTLGLHLIAGRNFTAADVTNKGFRDPSEANLVIITKPLADKLFPNSDAVGKVVYLDGSSTPSTVIGEVERLQVPSVSSWASSFVWNSTIEPVRLNSNFSRYAVRTKPGRLDDVMRAVPSKLYAVNPMRVLDDDSVKSFKDIRAEAYRADIGMAVLMGVICLILLAVTAAGIVGLTSFWVGQRHRQIGVRRALGARKIDILHYFQLENLMIAGGGAVVGVALAVGLNRLLMSKFEMESMPAYYVLVGLAVVVTLGQIAVFVPARRASNVPPVVATRAA